MNIKSILAKYLKKIVIGVIIAVVGGVIVAVIVSTCIPPKPPQPVPSLEMPLEIVGWRLWGGLQAEVSGNTVILNGRFDKNAGFKFTTPLNTTLRNKTAVLKIKNREISDFNNNAMLKITINQGDTLTPLRNVSNLIYDEYVPDWHDRIEFVLPPVFDGTFGFTFADAQLNRFEITLFYRN